jgi:hypothetical protein
VVRLMQPTWREVGGAPWLCPGGWVVSKCEVGTHLKGPGTVLLVLVGHREGARWGGREGGAHTGR